MPPKPLAEAGQRGGGGGRGRANVAEGRRKGWGLAVARVVARGGSEQEESARRRGGGVGGEGGDGLGQSRGGRSRPGGEDGERLAGGEGGREGGRALPRDVSERDASQQTGECRSRRTAPVGGRRGPAGGAAVAGAPRGPRWRRRMGAGTAEEGLGGGDCAAAALRVKELNFPVESWPMGAAGGGAAGRQQIRRGSGPAAPGHQQWWGAGGRGAPSAVLRSGMSCKNHADGVCKLRAALITFLLASQFPHLITVIVLVAEINSAGHRWLGGCPPLLALSSARERENKVGASRWSRWRGTGERPPPDRR